MNAVQLYRAQQLAISAAIDSGQFDLASDLLRRDLRTFAAPERAEPEQSGATGHKPRQKRKSKLLRILCRLLK
jgi:hypothetical protein